MLNHTKHLSPNISTSPTQSAPNYLRRIAAMSAVALAIGTPAAMARPPIEIAPRGSVPEASDARQQPVTTGLVIANPKFLALPRGLKARSAPQPLNAAPTARTNFTVPPVGPILLNPVVPTSVDAFIEQLPEWGKANKPKPNNTTTTPQGQTTETSEGRPYTVTRTHYSITETPQEIVTYQPVNGFWIGGMVQEKGLAQGIGSLQDIPVPATKRAAFKISTDLPMGDNFRQLNNPSTATASSAIGSLMQAGNNISWGGARTLKVVDNYSEEQTAHELGLDARYMTASLSASFKSERFGSKHTIAAAFIERAFTAQADFEGRSRREAFFRDNFTLADAQDLKKQGRITSQNLPAYVKSVTYGRVVLLNVTSTLTESEMKTALNASVNAGTFSVNANYNGSQKAKNADFEVRVTTLGGPQSGFWSAIPVKGFDDVLTVLKSYLQQPAPLSTMMPISYSINSLRDDSLAALAMTTDYTVTKYVANPIGERYKVKTWVTVTKSDDGVADNTLECYGQLRVNGDLWWSISSDESSTMKRGKGQTLEISGDSPHIQNAKPFTFDYYYDTKPKFSFDLSLFDHDSGSADDAFGKYNATIDLRSWAGKTAVWNYDSGHGEASQLHIQVERVDYL
ncbi:hypothetical protein EON83_19245 [bacterium]|nr:MAG: hypothetical protein EON83_19245 [bacterium]